MSLPWFPFNIKDFVANTKRLNTEAKGAYLELMLDYYQTETAPPDDDEVLATITGLSVESWKRHRRVIAPLFQIRDHLWTHDRIEQEILDGHHKHTKAVDRARVASEAAALKRTGKVPPKAPTKEPSKDNPKPAPQSRNHQGSNDGPKAGAIKDTPEAPQTQTQIKVVEGDAGVSAREAREAGRQGHPVSLSEIEDAMDSTQPVSMGVPFDLWQRNILIAEEHQPVLQAFGEYHIERGTFSRDWPTLWQTYLDGVLEAAKPKPPKVRKAPGRVEVNKRPEAIPGVRILISQEAYALADQVTEAMGVKGLPVTVGMPAQMQTWLAAWPAELILLAIQKVMARRVNDPPGSLKYFENAIAREVAESNRPLPVATLAPRQEIVTHGQRTETKSLSGAADRLIARIAAGDSGGADDGGGQGQAVAGPVPQIGRG